MTGIMCTFVLLYIITTIILLSVYINVSIKDLLLRVLWLSHYDSVLSYRNYTRNLEHIRGVSKGSWALGASYYYLEISALEN